MTREFEEPFEDPLKVVRKGYVDSPMGQVHYRTCGEGTPLLMLHMTPQSSLQFQNTFPLNKTQGEVKLTAKEGIGKLGINGEVNLSDLDSNIFFVRNKISGQEIEEEKLVWEEEVKLRKVVLMHLV